MRHMRARERKRERERSEKIDLLRVREERRTPKHLTQRCLNNRSTKGRNPKKRRAKNFFSLYSRVPHKKSLNNKNKHTKTDNRTHIHINTHGGGRESEPRGSSSTHSGRRDWRRALRFAQRQQHVLFKRHRAGTR